MAVGKLHRWNGSQWVLLDIIPAAHTHAIADISGLQTAIDGKADANHTHNNYVLTSDSRLSDSRPASSVSLSAISVDTINGKTKGNAILRQHTTSGNVVIGSDLQKLRLTGSEVRPKYARTNPLTDGTNYVELALLSDVVLAGTDGAKIVKIWSGYTNIYSSPTITTTSTDVRDKLLIIGFTHKNSAGYGSTYSIVRIDSTRYDTLRYCVSVENVSTTLVKLYTFGVQGVYNQPSQLNFTDPKYINLQNNGSTIVGASNLYLTEVWEVNP